MSKVIARVFSREFKLVSMPNELSSEVPK